MAEKKIQPKAAGTERAKSKTAAAGVEKKSLSRQGTRPRGRNEEARPRSRYAYDCDFREERPGDAGPFLLPRGRVRGIGSVGSSRALGYAPCLVRRREPSTSRAPCSQPRC